jgi:hypothetical protein
MMIAASLELVGDVATVILEIGKMVFQWVVTPFAR